MNQGGFRPVCPGGGSLFRASGDVERGRFASVGCGTYIQEVTSISKEGDPCRLLPTSRGGHINLKSFWNSGLEAPPFLVEDNIPMSRDLLLAVGSTMGSSYVVGLLILVASLIRYLKVQGCPQYLVRFVLV
ncbi:hypothetical protein GOP47_0008131 [Adiantum capillus-veneris]|uniref:Uncharacterized protein n=1 Tax=Adiantum capillus-veneris TaxID=13818 RepID=A0A9D4UXV6_ADICA|nr:hypothetical protein GOP47_0008131 [Adiantum capillus-veneris]